MKPYYWIIPTLILVAHENSAQAYLEPGTGSYFFQLLIASLLGALFSVKFFWQGLVERCRACLPSHKQPSAPNVAEEPVEPLTK